MAQQLKDDVRQRIVAAAARAFADRGIRAPIAAIARDAGVSAGNVYLYFPSKQALFDAVVPAAVAGRLTELLEARVRALAGVPDPAASPEWLDRSEALMRWCVDHRLAVVVLLARAEGTPFEGFRARTIDALVGLALDHWGSVRPDPPPPAVRFALVGIYAGFVAAIADALATFEGEAELRDAVAWLSRYHLAGLRALFEAEAS